MYIKRKQSNTVKERHKAYRPVGLDKNNLKVYILKNETFAFQVRRRQIRKKAKQKDMYIAHH